MEYILKARLVDNPVTVGNKEDKILLPGNPENAILTDIYRLMKTEDAGLHEEAICHVTNLFQRVFARLVLSGTRSTLGSPMPLHGSRMRLSKANGTQKKALSMYLWARANSCPGL
ncbi:DNA-binding domain-containing protein [Bacteroides fragilis]|uniref:DNA-binding domain-containing protein n=1 Tax=Bacteroides fragilis TaxID=817 RepID=UPI00203043DB|nr:DNA-binding domain-containing protein [Bacteroides fragilis]MCM0314377.1 hypothetical protein [Bacteroides fragilis]